MTKRCRVQHRWQPGAGSTSRGPKDAAVFTYADPLNEVKAIIIFPILKLHGEDPAILLQIEFHKPSKQFGLSLRNRLSSSSLFDGGGGGQ